MLRLAIDTSTPIASVALRSNDTLLEREEQVTTFSERLMELVDELFVEAGRRPAELEAVICGAGPGSFTGLRIGLATAKGLCLGTGCKLLMVSSLEALALRGRGTVLAALDAFRGEVYAGVYEVGDTVRVIEPPFTALPAALPAAAQVVGNAYDKFPVPVGATRLVGSGPRARELLELAAPRLAAGGHDDPRTAAPSYVRASAPEEALRASKLP